MILALYKQLKEIARAEFGDIVMGVEVIVSHTGRARKLRMTLIDDTFVDVWHSQDGDYAYHWEQRERRDFVYRHDNAPHKAWRKVSTFPKHCHEGTQSHVTESHLPEEPVEAMREFLRQVRRLMIRFGSEEQSKGQ